mmetsp:Transcript_71679/g.155705  ORF Transcript_71679/g.155705 Transcript_71679/m.155705 type:complete len:217 (-) Transcript_71679:732-1382(-)
MCKQRQSQRPREPHGGVAQAVHHQRAPLASRTSPKPHGRRGQAKRRSPKKWGSPRLSKSRGRARRTRAGPRGPALIAPPTPGQAPPGHSSAGSVDFQPSGTPMTRTTAATWRHGRATAGSPEATQRRARSGAAIGRRAGTETERRALPTPRAAKRKSDLRSATTGAAATGTAGTTSGNGTAVVAGPRRDHGLGETPDARSSMMWPLLTTMRQRSFL